jgi:beta-barrel assembly-enhancing protease
MATGISFPLAYLRESTFVAKGVTMSYSSDYAYGPGDAGPHVSPRWIAALIITVIAVAIYYFESDTNPVTGKKQHVAMNVNQEIRLGLDSAPQMAAEMGGAADPRDDPRARFVADVGRRLVQESDARRSPYVGNYHFFLLNDPDTINAFALPGGQIFITRGLFDKLDDEAELAGVLGHEIGHVVNRHAAEHMATSRLGQLLTLAVGVGASAQDQGGNAQMIAAFVNQMTQLKFTRGDESEADLYGLRYMAESGYDPSAMLDVMKILKEAGRSSRQPEILSTHPLPETRIVAIREILAREYSSDTFRDLTRGRSLRSRP